MVPDWLRRAVFDGWVNGYESMPPSLYELRKLGWSSAWKAVRARWPDPVSATVHSAGSVPFGPETGSAAGRVPASCCGLRTTRSSLACRSRRAADNRGQGGRAVTAPRLVRLASLALLLGSAPSFAQVTCPAVGSFSWLDGGRGSWVTPTNWTPAGPPTSGADVCFTTPTANPTLPAGTTTVGDGECPLYRDPHLDRGRPPHVRPSTTGSTPTKPSPSTASRMSVRRPVRAG